MNKTQVIRGCGKAKDVFNAIAWLARIQGSKTLKQIIKEMN